MRVLLLIILASLVALAQERTASQRQLDAVNGKFRALGEPRTMKVGFNPFNGDVTFQFVTKDRNIGIGAATEQGILYFSIVAFGEPPRANGSLTPRLVSSSRIEMNPDGTDGKTLNATDAQLAQVSQKISVDGGKVETLTLRIDEQGALSYTFTSAAGTKVSDVIKP